MTHKEAMAEVRALARAFGREGNRRGVVLAESALAWYKKLTAAMRSVESLSRKLEAHTKNFDAVREQIRLTNKKDMKRIKRLSLKLKKVEAAAWKDLERFERATKAESTALKMFESKIVQIEKLEKKAK